MGERDVSGEKDGGDVEEGDKSAPGEGEKGGGGKRRREEKVQ